MNLQDLSARAADAETFLKALANRYRLMILCELHKGERSVTALQNVCGLSQSSLSQHLARLREDGLVGTRREAQTIYYSLADKSVSLVIGLLHDLYCTDRSSAAATSRKKGNKKVVQLDL
jgi:ArsR family transcriptional regulator, virulence genes transcriptional regulator